MIGEASTAYVANCASYLGGGSGSHKHARVACFVVCEQGRAWEGATTGGKQCRGEEYAREKGETRGETIQPVF